jgi:septation ring formation regulator EzrA
MEKILSNITDIIETYESGVWTSLEDLRKMLRELTSNIYHLTKFNIEFHERHNAVQYKHKGSVSAGLILANEQIPELRMCRKIIESANNVSRSITMELSIIKNEK